ncbi:MAG: amino acid ABC transporter permease, partial [Pseudomonadota bacterium]|nr:amino acid ABC transporter permease [Pseudomonadota bacterium]
TPNRTLQLAIIPQALPLIIPPLTSNYLNLTKNSSLAVAIGYFDIVATIGTISLMQTGKEVETMVIVLSTYLVLSLIISGSMNLLNYRLKIKGR